MLEMPTKTQNKTVASEVLKTITLEDTTMDGLEKRNPDAPIKVPSGGGKDQRVSLAATLLWRRLFDDEIEESLETTIDGLDLNAENNDESIKKVIRTLIEQELDERMTVMIEQNHSKALNASDRNKEASLRKNAQRQGSTTRRIHAPGETTKNAWSGWVDQDLIKLYDLSSDSDHDRRHDRKRKSSKCHHNDDRYDNYYYDRYNGCYDPRETK